MSIIIDLSADTLAVLRADAEAQGISVEEAAARCLTDLYAGMDAAQVKEAFRMMGELPAICAEMREQQADVARLRAETTFLKDECRRLQGKASAVLGSLRDGKQVMQ